MEQTAKDTQAANVLTELRNRFAENKDFLNCVESLQRGESATFDSVWGSACALLTSALADQFDKILVITGDAKTQDRFIDDLPTFCEKRIERFPSCLMSSDPGISIDLDYGERLR